MRFTCLGLAVAFVLFGVVGCAQTSEMPDVPPVHRHTVAEGNNRFALNLYGQLAQEEDGNLFMSPFSVSTALAMTYAGANGETEAQMADMLHMPLPPKKLHPAFRYVLTDLNKRVQKSESELRVANSLWGQKDFDFRKDFLTLLQENYDAPLHEVNFQTPQGRQNAADVVNAWVKEKTEDKIKKLIQPGMLTELTRLILTNAIYFKGTWAQQFKPRKTRDAPFTLADGSEVEVPTMHESTKFRFADLDDMKAVELPYSGGELSMIILLPDEHDGLSELEKSFTFADFKRTIGNLRETEVNLALPKFTVKWESTLSETLKKMGMKDAFSLPPADFSGMTGKKDLFLQEVVHKAFVEVNEEGTEAAAATGAIVGTTSIVVRKTFRADHPFLFFIRDRETGSILFMGRVTNPAADSA